MALGACFLYPATMLQMLVYRFSKVLLIKEYNADFGHQYSIPRLENQADPFGQDVTVKNHVFTLSFFMTNSVTL